MFGEACRDFVRDFLGPTLEKSEAGKNVKIIGLDDDRFQLPSFARTVGSGWFYYGSTSENQKRFFHSSLPSTVKLIRN